MVLSVRTVRENLRFFVRFTEIWTRQQVRLRSDLSLIHIFSCSKFLEENPKDKLPEDDVYNTISEVYLNAVASLYTYAVSYTHLALPVQLKEARMKDRKQMLFLLITPKIPQLPSPESYTLSVTSQRIEIRATSGAGLFLSLIHI